tara:strand:- start:54 stop:281 length:228 start_codon:yes stop_codon:yes gene_type:complete
MIEEYKEYLISWYKGHHNEVSLTRMISQSDEERLISFSEVAKQSNEAVGCIREFVIYEDFPVYKRDKIINEILNK